MDKAKAAFFREQLLYWHSRHQRPMPWKGVRDPYLIWLSEIILQQTRVEQGRPYFERFSTKYPTVELLAAAPEDEVMKLWEGLGYYSRAKNMHATARQIATTYGGRFPESYEGILQLKGVGPYTAAAIASFAYDLPFAVVDGNVYRVLARFFGIDIPVDTTDGQKLFRQMAQQLLDHRHPGGYNQAIMDFGAGVCTPATARCDDCPMAKECSAKANGTVAQLPVKSKRLQRKERNFNYLVINAGKNVWIRKRTGKDIWQGLYEFPLLETDELVDSITALTDNPLFQDAFPGNNLELIKASPPYKQELTHQRIIARFWEFNLAFQGEEINLNQGIKVERKNLNKFAFPKVVDRYLSDNSLYLRLL